MKVSRRLDTSIYDGKCKKKQTENERYQLVTENSMFALTFPRQHQIIKRGLESDESRISE